MMKNRVCFFTIFFVITSISGMIIGPVSEVQSPTVAGLNADVSHISAAKLGAPSASEVQTFTVAVATADLGHKSAVKIGAQSLSEAQSFIVAGEDADLGHKSAVKIGSQSLSEAQPFIVAGEDADHGHHFASKIGAPSVSEAQWFTVAGGDADLGHDFAVKIGAPSVSDAQSFTVDKIGAPSVSETQSFTAVGVNPDLHLRFEVKIGAPSVSEAQSFTCHTSAKIEPPSVSEADFMIRSRRLLSTPSNSNEKCTKCCPAETSKSIISKIVGWMMVHYMIATICYFVYALRKSFQDQRYLVVLEEGLGDKHSIGSIVHEDLMELYQQKHDLYDIKHRQATLLDMHIEDMKEGFLKLRNRNKLRRIFHAAQHTMTVLQAACSPFLMFYIAIRICWPAMVVIGVAKPWDEELESIHRTVD